MTKNQRNGLDKLKRSKLNTIDYLFLSISFLFCAHFLNLENNKQLIEIGSTSIAIIGGLVVLYSIAIERASNKLTKENRTLGLTVIVGLFIVISLQALLGISTKISIQSTQQFSFFIFILYSSKKQLSSKVALVVSWIVAAANSPFVVQAFLVDGYFRASSTPSPLSNSHDCAFILATLVALNMSFAKLSQTEGKSRSKHILVSCVLGVEIIGYRAFGALFLIILFLTFLSSTNLKTGRIRAFKLSFQLVLTIPIFAITKFVSDISFAAKTGNAYRFSSGTEYYGSGRVGAWNQTVGEIRDRGMAELLFGQGVGTDIRLIDIWGGYLGSHNYALSLVYEYGFIMFSIVIFSILRYVISVKNLPGILLLSAFVASITTSSVLWQRTIPNLVLALTIVTLGSLSYTKREV